jgi:hypothetical protein
MGKKTRCHRFWYLLAARRNGLFQKPNFPKIGDRLGESKRFADGEIYHRQSDWLVAKVQSYPAVGEDCDWDEIILCYCQFEPIESKWERVATLEEIVAQQVAKDTGLEVVKG